MDGSSVRRFNLAVLIVGLFALVLHATAAAPAGLAADRTFSSRSLSDSELRSLAPGPLAQVPVPEPANLGDFVQDRSAAIVLGKALFWDMQVGSDGVQACASCHFQAGADNRARNQLSPGLNAGDETFQLGGPNYSLQTGDFPFPKEVNDVVSSQGVHHTEFLGLEPGPEPGTWLELFSPLPSIFQVGSINVRQVEPRNSPTVINAVFNFRNFWDGRANNVFNGTSPFGLRDPDAGVWVLREGELVKERVVLEDSSLASQAVGPPGNALEMSSAGRTFPDIGRKLLALKPLAKQAVHPQDSVLGPLRDAGGMGLSGSYAQLIRQAFQPELWEGQGTVDGGFTQIEANFSLFFGVAVQLYEATLVSDQTRVDQFAGGEGVLTEEEKLGLEMFLTKGRCINCHGGPEFTNAASHLGQQQEGLLERMIMGDGNPAVYDNGFYNIGVRATAEDLGVGGTDPWGNPLSFTRQLTQGPKVDDFEVDPSNFEVQPGVDVQPGERDAVDGAFKVPTLRNIELTGPYLHNGGHGTLEHTVEFYDRGGDFSDENSADLDADIVPLGFTPEEEDALVAFLKALTDERVRWERAPFDHPQLFIPNGHRGNESLVFDDDLDGRADDDLLELPAVGISGRGAEGLGPLIEFLPGVNRVQTRAGWNLIAGGPGSDTGGRVIFAYDGAVYHSGLAATMEAGRGYWVNTPTSTALDLTTTALPLSVHLTAGWNLIGNSTAGRVRMPAGLVAYTYDGGFVSTSSLEPGQGAWVKSPTGQDVELEPEAGG